MCGEGSMWIRRGNIVIRVYGNFRKGDNWVYGSFFLY